MTAKISIFGFNNLTKNLSFSLYKLHYLPTQGALLKYNQYISEQYGAKNLTLLLTKVCHAIGGNILNIAQQDYQPQGASVTLMISEEAQPESVVAHLDKSHLCIHTYPEESPQKGVAIFRADIELSTCGVISPLEVLNYIIEEFNADMVDIDYRIRGMTRDATGNKIYSDNNLQNISDHLNAQLTTAYRVENHNLASRNLFHAKLCKTNIRLEDYLLNGKLSMITTAEQSGIINLINQEILQLFVMDS